MSKSATREALVVLAKRCKNQIARAVYFAGSRVTTQCTVKPGGAQAQEKIRK